MNNILCTKCAFDVLGEHCGLAGFTNQYPRTSCSAYNNIVPTGFVLGNDGYFHWVKNKDPMYRPFANADECWNEMLKHQPMLKCKEISIDRDVYIAIVRIKTDGIETDTQRFGFIDALKRFTFADGTPFGIKEESEG